MATASEPTSTLVTDMAALAWVELMAAYGVELSETSVNWSAHAEDPVLFGVIGFGGNGIRATCLLGAEQSLVEASSRVVSRPRDWIAELANQLVGRLKMKLLTCGVNVTMTTPLALSGVHVTPLPRLSRDPRAFTSARGKALLWLELEAEENFALSPEEPLGLEPGDLVF